jgi:hypothetical protein
MKTSKLVLIPLTLASLLGGCAVYGPAPVAYYPPGPVYVAPQPVYVQPPVTFGFYGYSRGWRHGHHR